MPSDESPEDLVDPPSAAADPWPPAEFELVLRKPVTLEGTTVDRLQLREPTCWEWEQIVAQPEDKQRRYAVQLISGVSIKLIALMGVGDVVRAERYIIRFFEVGRTIAVA